MASDLRGSRHQARERDLGGPRFGAKKIVVNKDDTTIVVDDDDGPSTKPCSGAVSQIKRQAEETTSDYDREKLQERLAKLVGGVAQSSRSAPPPRPR